MSPSPVGIYYRPFLFFFSHLFSPPFFLKFQFQVWFYLQRSKDSDLVLELENTPRGPAAGNHNAGVAVRRADATQVAVTRN